MVLFSQVPVRRVVAVVVVAVVSVVHSPSRATAAAPPTYVAPVDAPVLDPFRPPTSPYGPGNRGIEYGTTPGTPVRAAGDGEVRFAGAVAASLHVTVGHPDGIRTSYSFLVETTVAQGAEVRQGQVVGIAGARLHVGARRGETYIDPASLWGRVGPPRVELVPLDGGGAADRTDRTESSRDRQGFRWRWW